MIKNYCIKAINNFINSFSVLDANFATYIYQQVIYSVESLRMTITVANFSFIKYMIK